MPLTFSSVSIGHFSNAHARTNETKRYPCPQPSDADVCKLTAFWPNCFEHSDLCHILQNAIEDACTAEPDWKAYEEKLKASCKILGDRSYKEIILEECYRGSSSVERMFVHHFSSEHVDWRWEYLEHASEDLTNVWPAFSVRFRPGVFTDAVALSGKVMGAIECPWCGFFCSGKALKSFHMQVLAVLNFLQQATI